MTASLHIETERLLLRALTEDDVAPLASILSKPEVAAWWSDYDDERIREELLVEHAESKALAIDLGGEVIGLIQMYAHPDPDYRHAGIDLFLDPESWGVGYATEAIGAAVRYLHHVRGHHRIVIDPAANNERAIRLYERAGFRRIGLLRQYERTADGAWRDGVLMELLPGESAPGATSTRPLPSVSLRRAELTDQDTIIPIMVAFNHEEGIDLGLSALDLALQRLLSDESLGQLWLIERDEHTIGYAVITFGYDLEFDGRDAYLTELYLLPDERGSGAAASALALVEEEAKAAGVHALHLGVRPNNSRAIQLYRRAGYLPQPRDFWTKRLIPKL